MLADSLIDKLRQPSKELCVVLHSVQGLFLVKGYNNSGTTQLYINFTLFPQHDAFLCMANYIILSLESL